VTVPYTDSVPVTAELALQGLWVHDPQDPSGTVKNYPYGRAQRSSGLSTDQTALMFAGRSNPVVDFGEHQTAQMSAQIDLPESTDRDVKVEELQEFAVARRTICVRDNRGRKFFGAIDDVNDSDEDWGTRVGMKILRVDYSEGSEASA
jgi:hypothetical protein